MKQFFYFVFFFTSSHLFWFGHLGVYSSKTLFFPHSEQNFEPFIKDVPLHPPDPIFTLEDEFAKDPYPNKVNLGIGKYVDEHGRFYVFPSVRKVQRDLLDPSFVDQFYQEHNISTEYMPSDGLFDEDYLPQLGFHYLTEIIEDLVFQAPKGTFDNSRIVSFHTVSSTAALGATLQFLEDFVNFSSVAVSIPTWSEYEMIAKAKCPEKPIKKYRYVSPSNPTVLDIDGMLEDLNNLPERSVVVLQASCHNPSGVDPSPEQWKLILDVFLERSLFPIIDAAYLGFVTGDIVEDSQIIRSFQKTGIEYAVTVSFSKNLGLYGERVGTGHIITKDVSIVKNVSSQIEGLVLPQYGAPPLTGARIAYFVFDKYYDQWKSELGEVVGRIQNMRNLLVESLKKRGIDWSHISLEKGLFTMIPLDSYQLNRLKTEHHVYVVQNGRLNLAGLTEKNVEYVADAIKDVY